MRKKRATYRKCVICGKKFRCKGKTHKYCSTECREEGRKRLRAERQPETPEPKERKRKKKVDHGNKCVHDDCLFRRKLEIGVKYCDHLSMTGHIRGCPSDETCTKYIEFRGRKRPKHVWDVEYYKKKAEERRKHG